MGRLHDYLERNGLSECEVSILFLKLKIKAEQTEKSAAWILFVEYTTRIATQQLDNDSGTEKRALDSLYELFKRSRDVLVQHGRIAQNFSVTTVYTMNTILRPFLSKWHRENEINKAFENKEKCIEFRKELKLLQPELIAFTLCLADVAGVPMEITEKLLPNTINQ